MKYNPLLVFLLFLSTYSLAQIKEKQAVDSLFSKWNSTSTPGAALGIIKDGKLFYTQGYGIADLEHDVPITDNSIFNICSVSKQFTAMCILLLEEQGKLNLTDDIRKYLPELPDYGEPITILHCLNHTSGLRDNLSLWELAGNDPLGHIDKEKMYELVCKQKQLNYHPGDEFMYSNCGYFLMGLIVEKLSGEPLKEYARKNIFEPLKMYNTFYHDDNTRIIKNRAVSYENESGELKNKTMRYDLVGSGGIYSNVHDLYLWDQNFYHNTLGKGTNTLLEKLQKEGLLKNGEPTGTGYALGIQIGEYQGLKTVSHSGGLAGYRIYLLRFPMQNFSVVLLGNYSQIDPEGLSYDIAGIFLKDKFTQPVSETKPEKKSKPKGKTSTKKVTKIPLNQLVGSYELRPGMTAEISVKNDSLYVFQNWNQSSYPIVRTSGNTYKMLQDSPLLFVFSDVKDNYAQSFTLVQGENEFPLKRKIEVKFSDLNAEDYVGTYYSEELNAFYKISVVNGKYELKIPEGKPEGLIISDVNLFLGKEMTIQFTRTDEKVVGFNLGADRVKNLKFVKR